MSSNLPGDTPKKSYLSNASNSRRAVSLPAPVATTTSAPTVAASSTRVCPHCRVTPIGPVKKLLFGPLFKFRCSGCGGQWRVSWWSVGTALIAIASTPVLLGLAWTLGLLRPSANSVLEVGVAVLVVAGLVITHFVPVRKAG